MECGAGILGIFTVQDSEPVGSLGLSRLQGSKSGFVAVDQITILIPRIQRFEYIGRSVSALHNKGSDRPKTVTSGFLYDLSRNTNPGAGRFV